ncbi:MAG: ribose-phosphate pyrophosphokinase, partial [Tritonibacter mobilis]|nr:ribose-phosphate pyrophosphokinase [Tritonibacter mobilis]
MPTLNEPKLIAGNANLPLAKSISRRMSMHRGVDQELVSARVERFNDGEIFVEVYENVRGEDMFIIQPTSNPANDNLMELLIIADALRRSSAQRITAVIPYFGYARQDRRTKARTPISAKLVANMLTGAGIERVLTLDLHAAQIQGFFDIPVDNLYASPIFALDVKAQFKDSMDDLMVVSPDVGGVARARELAKRINAPLSIVDKRREKAGEIAEMTVIGDVKDKICLIVDDMCDTAGTLCKAAQILLDNGAKEVHAYISHGVMSGPAVERVTNSVMKSLVLTDSIQPSEAVLNAPNIRILPTAPLF